MEAIINANYSNKVTSTNVLSSFKNVKLTALFLGHKLHENVNWNFMEGYSFEGRLADVNIWDWELQEDHVGKWYRGTGRDERPKVAWNRLGYPSKRFGDVHLVTISSAFFGRGMSRKKKISFELGQKKCRTSCRNVPESHDEVCSLREGVRFRESIHTCIAKEKVSGRMFEGNLLHQKFELQYV